MGARASWASKEEHSERDLQNDVIVSLIPLPFFLSSIWFCNQITQIGIDSIYIPNEKRDKKIRFPSKNC